MQDRRKPVAEKIFHSLRKDIQKGKYIKGSYLPSENCLCELFNASRGTIRSVLRRLESDGLIRIYPHKGSCVSAQGDIASKKRFLTIVSDITSTESMHILSGICTEAGNKNSEIILAFDKNVTSKEIIERYVSKQIDGVIYIECYDFNSKIQPLEKASIPCVIANLEDEMDCVSTKVDFRNTGRTAAQHLLEYKHTNCAMLVGRSFFYKELIAGFRGTLAEENILFSERNIFYADTEKEALKESIKILNCKKKYSAIFTGRDNKAAIFYQVCREKKINIPKDISVISYDNITWRESSALGLTTITEPAAEMGEAAIKLICRWLDENTKPNSITILGELLKNKSVKLNRQ